MMMFLAPFLLIGSRGPRDGIAGAPPSTAGQPIGLLLLLTKAS